MRLARLYQKGHCPAYYHLMAHLHPALAYLRPHHKEYLLSLLQRLASVFAIKIISFAIMDNHIHLLVYVPCPASLSEAEAQSRALRLYPAGVVFSRPGSYWRQALLDISRFMKELNQRFAQWYNRQEKTRGKVYFDRFRSVVVEEGVHAAVVSAYVELNPLKAGLEKKLGDYPWSSLRHRAGGWLLGIEEALGLESGYYRDFLRSFEEKVRQHELSQQLWFYRGRGYFYGSEAFVRKRLEALPFRRRIKTREDEAIG